MASTRPSSVSTPSSPLPISPTLPAASCRSYPPDSQRCAGSTRSWPPPPPTPAPRPATRPPLRARSARPSRASMLGGSSPRAQRRPTPLVLHWTAVTRRRRTRRRTRTWRWRKARRARTPPSTLARAPTRGRSPTRRRLRTMRTPPPRPSSINCVHCSRESTPTLPALAHPEAWAPSTTRTTTTRVARR